MFMKLFVTPGILLLHLHKIEGKDPLPMNKSIPRRHCFPGIWWIKKPQKINRPDDGKREKKPRQVYRCEMKLLLIMNI
jgi:hypothetical protein